MGGVGQEEHGVLIFNIKSCLTQEDSQAIHVSLCRTRQRLFSLF